jgi:alpha-L-rhamnosidase
MTGAGATAEVRVVELRIDDDSGQVATGHASPRLSWTLESASGDIRQSEYEIEVATDPGFKDVLARSGVVRDARPYLAPWPAPPLRSREVRWWRVRVTTSAGTTAWSEPRRVEASLLDASDWKARPISPASNAGRKTSGPAPLLRREFALDKTVANARLYLTALGVHEVAINGRAICPDVLEPGWTVYPKRLLYSTYDVTDLLRRGANVVSAAIGDGWYRGDLTWNLTRNNYGDTTALLAQLEITFVDGEVCVVATDESWRGSYGAIREAELYHGVSLDFRCEPDGWRESGFDDRDWESVVALALPAGLECRDMPAVRVLERRKLELPAEREPGAPIRLDTGQNLTGYLSIHARGPSGATIMVRHAEVLDESGALNAAPLRNARATDSYVLDGRGTCVLKPPFTFHGFRYAEIITTPGVVLEAVTADVLASDLERTGQFSCSHDGLNRLYENCLWSQRGNFLAVPTDCPQRDERLGWTGDMQVFAPTACLNSDSLGFLRSWLKDLKLEQRADGSVPVTIPDVIRAQGQVQSAAAWGDAATIVPWVLYRAYGDKEILRSQRASMRAWVDWCVSRTEADGTWSKDFQFGDWLDPDAPHNKPYKAKTHFGFVATAYLSFSAGLVADAEEMFGDVRAAGFYRELKTRSAAAAWARWAENAMATPTGCALAIEFDIAPRELHAGLGERLATLVAGNGFRVGTGFVGTPLVLPALTRTGQIEAAYRLLLNRDCPGWLYQVDRGATTIWERWDAVRPDGGAGRGSPIEAGLSTMISYNHYAYGAVAAWFYNTIAGLNVDLSKEPEEQIVLAPRPGGALQWARAELDIPYGRLSVAWRIVQRALEVDAVVPAGAVASLFVPPGYRAGDACSPLRLVSGTHALRFGLA